MDLPAPLAWLVDEACASPGPDRFLAELGGRLLADGLPLAGGALTLAVPHPIIARRTWLWRAETGAVIEALGFAGGPLSQAGRGGCITFAVPGVPAEAIQPVGIAITRDRKLAFVALGPANRVAVIDAQSYEVMKYLLVGQRVWSLAFNPDQSRVYTTNGVSNDISVIDVGSLKVIKSVPVGQLPWGVVSRP
jgi:YVTN family beta-propeller protein